MSNYDAARELERQAMAVMRERMKEAGRYVAAQCRAAAPVRSGKLKSSIRSTYKESPTTMRFVVSAGQFARFLEFGTRNPKRKDGKPSRSGSEWRIKPSLWLEKAFLQAMPHALDILKGN